MNLRNLGTPMEWLGDLLIGMALVIGMPALSVFAILVFG